ncbi:hypothetical protein [Leptolyngbya sp. AN10]|uniref:hypothetical protein n=1 Tax=Leptolyngbya sp. AN10 TaxID=3423365 RepID=UPI003D31B74A
MTEQQSGSIQQAITTIESLHLEILLTGVNICRDNLSSVEMLNSEIDRIKGLLQSSSASKTIQEYASVLANLMHQRSTLLENATVLYMSSLRPMMTLKAIAENPTPKPDPEPVVSDDTDATSSLTPDDLATLRSLGINFGVDSATGEEDDDDEDDEL